MFFDQVTNELTQLDSFCVAKWKPTQLAKKVLHVNVEAIHEQRVHEQDCSIYKESLQPHYQLCEAVVRP